MKAVKKATSDVINFYAWIGGSTGSEVLYTINYPPNTDDKLYNANGKIIEPLTIRSYSHGDDIMFVKTGDSFVSYSYSRDNLQDFTMPVYIPQAIKRYQLIPNPATITIPNVSILGGLTSADNILNDFSENNYAQLPQDLQFNTEGNQWDDSWEIEFKIKLNNEATTGTDSAIISTSLSRSYNPRLVVWNNLQVALLLTNSTNSWNVCEINSGNTYLTIGDWYWIKVTCLGWASSKSDYNLYISTDGTNYSRVGGKLSTNSYTATALKNIGFCHDNSNGDLNFKGEIDLSESYIKVNNNIWWEGTKELNIQ